MNCWKVFISSWTILSRGEPIDSSEDEEETCASEEIASEIKNQNTF
jgi:hypothetical protein